jgi:RHS repeat-associated protein
LATFKYEPFGTIREETGTVINPYKYTGREYDEDSGLYYYRARYYDSEVGRFLSKDSLGKIYDNNLYVYVLNNPLKYTDPTGNYYLWGMAENLLMMIGGGLLSSSGYGAIIGVPLIGLGLVGLVICGISSEEKGREFMQTYGPISKGAAYLLPLFWGLKEKYMGGDFLKGVAEGNLCFDIILSHINTAVTQGKAFIQWLVTIKDIKSILDIQGECGSDVTSIEDWLHFSIDVSPEKAEYKRGETVRVAIFVRNNEEQETIWLGVSFKDPTGESVKYDPEIIITPESATIDHDETKTFTAEWTVPDDAPAGVYKIAVNCWRDNTFTDWYSDDLEWASIFNVPTEAGKYQKWIIINENSGKTLTDYQIMVDLRGADFPDKAKTDGADIRFYDAEGEELSYWIEEYDYAGKHAKIWVKVPGIPANGETRIMMYYGDEEAGTVSDGDKVFAFFDDFEDGDISDWSGTASVVDFRGRKWIKLASGWGKYVGISHKMPLHDNFAIEFLEYENSGEQDDYDLGVDLYEDQGSIRIVYMVGDNFDRHDLPKARLKHLESITCGILACWQEPAGENCQICAEEQNLGIFAECTQRSTAIKYGENLVLKTEGTYSANLHGTYNLGIFNAVSLAFGEFCGTKKVDFVAVRKYTSPEPTITIGA